MEGHLLIYNILIVVLMRSTVLIKTYPNLNFNTAPPLCTAVVCSGRENCDPSQVCSLSKLIRCSTKFLPSYGKVTGFGSVSLRGEGREYSTSFDSVINCNSNDN